MTQPSPISSRKRSSPDDGAQPDGSTIYEPRFKKRQRTPSLETASSLDPRPSVSEECMPPTPPSSVTGPATLALKLVIPQEQISREQQRKINRHRADAERWKPKLQRPYPTASETRNAYPLKLMRHYHSTTAHVQPNFIAPKIDKSPRLSRLLQQFPLMTTCPAADVPGPIASQEQVNQGQVESLSGRMAAVKKARSTLVQLQTNIRITRSEHAQRLAWQAFSLPEEGRLDRGREAMMQSGLDVDALELEAAGRDNQLPDWKKPWTGRFVVGRQTDS